MTQLVGVSTHDPIDNGRSFGEKLGRETGGAYTTRKRVFATTDTRAEVRDRGADQSGRGAIDIGALTQGAWAGFSVLVLGGLAQPIIAAYVEDLSIIAVVLTAGSGFVVGGWRIGNTDRPMVQGAIAAMASYLLLLPVLFLLSFGPKGVEVGGTLAIAAVIGAVTGYCRARYRSDGKSETGE